MTDSLRDTLEFSTLTPADAEEVSDMDIRLFDNGFGPSQIRAEIAAGVAVGIRLHGHLVAYAMARKDGVIVDITRVGVHEDHRSRGLGKGVLRYLMEEVPGERYILCVRKTNLHAMKLYVKEGFQIIGMCEQSWVMLKLHELTSA